MRGVVATPGHEGKKRKQVLDLRKRVTEIFGRGMHLLPRLGGCHGTKKTQSRSTFVLSAFACIYYWLTLILYQAAGESINEIKCQPLDTPEWGRCGMVN